MHMYIHIYMNMLFAGHTFGEFCVVACAKGQTIVRAVRPTSVVEITMEVMCAHVQLWVEEITMTGIHA